MPHLADADLTHPLLSELCRSTSCCFLQTQAARKGPSCDALCLILLDEPLRPGDGGADSRSDTTPHAPHADPALLVEIQLFQRISGGLLFADPNAAKAFLGLLLLGGYGKEDIPLVLVRSLTVR